MPVTVFVRSGTGPKGESPSAPSPSITLDAPLIVVGRGEQCDVRLPDPSVSHRHATIRQRGSEYVLIDEGSVNGTFLGGFRLGTLAPRVLRHGDLVRVGRIWLEVRLDRAVPTTQSVMATKELALALVARALESREGAAAAALRIASGPDEGKTLRLVEPGRVNVIGRDGDADLVLSDKDASRRHIQVVRRAEHLFVRDLGSKNGAELGPERVPVERDRLWRAGEQVHLGNTTLVYEHRAAEALVEIERAIDEVMQPDEPVTPPAPLVGSTAAPSPAVTSIPAAPNEPRAPHASGAEDARVLEKDGRPTGKPRTSTRGGLSPTDMLVVLLSLGVLGLSIVGLLWLFRG